MERHGAEAAAAGLADGEASRDWIAAEQSNLDSLCRDWGECNGARRQVGFTSWAVGEYRIEYCARR